MIIDFGQLTFELVDRMLRIKNFCGFSGDSSLHNFVEVQVAGENHDAHRGAKQIKCSESNRLLYVSHEINGNTLKIVQRSELVCVTNYFTKFNNTNAVRCFSEVKNIVKREIVIEHISSFVGWLGRQNPNNTYYYRFTNSHHSECQPIRQSFFDMGLFGVSKQSQKRIAHANTGTWSCKEQMPQGIIESGNQFLMFQIESGSNWYYEISDYMEEYYLNVGGGNLQSRRRSRNRG